MPTRRHQHPESTPHKESDVPNKENAYRNKKPLTVAQTAQTDKPRINALATAGKKKKPK